MADIVVEPVIGLGVADEKHKAIVQAALELINERPAQSYVFRHDLTNVEAEKLPALIAESSLEEYIEPGLSETHIRRLLTRSYELKALKGLVVGTKLGLELLGMTVEWKQWFEQEPMAQAGTHEVTVFVNEQIFEDALMLLSRKVQLQALRMIENTKRQSQHIAFRIGLKSDVSIGIGASFHAIQQQNSIGKMQNDAVQKLGVGASLGGINIVDMSMGVAS